MNIMSEGGENDGKTIQVNPLNKSKTKEIMPAMSIKYLLKSFRVIECLTKLIF